jgi:hypothetical protein
MTSREYVENKVKKNLNKKIPKNTELDDEKVDVVVSKVLNSYIKYQNRKINNYHKHQIEIFDNVNYHEKVVLFD